MCGFYLCLPCMFYIDMKFMKGKQFFDTAKEIDTHLTWVGPNYFECHWVSSLNSYCLLDKIHNYMPFFFWSLNWIGETWIRGFFGFSPFLNCCTYITLQWWQFIFSNKDNVPISYCYGAVIWCLFFFVFFHANRAWSNI